MISIVGKSESGKTTLIERLIPEFRQRGYKVGSIKHASHGFDIDNSSKDSFRHRRAGSETVVVASPEQIAVLMTVDTDSLDTLEFFFQDKDLVLAEGYKNEPRPKIEIFSKKRHAAPINPNDENLIAFVTDDAIDVKVPLFNTEQISELADLIEEKYLAAPQLKRHGRMR